MARAVLTRGVRKQTVEKLKRAYANEPDLAERRATTRMKAKFLATIKDKW